MSTQNPFPDSSGAHQGWPSAPRYDQQPRRTAWQNGYSAPMPGGPQPPSTPAGKSYTVAWALSLLLGIWGVDRFYLGRWMTGLLKFFTMGGFFIWYLVDLILILTGSLTDVRGRPLRQYESMKWTTRIVSGIAMVAVFGMFTISGLVQQVSPPPESPVAGLTEVEDGEQRLAESENVAEESPSPTPTSTPEAVPTDEVTEAADGTALAVLAGLEEKGRAPKTGYDRDSFGWRDDLDRNGCDTRNDILRRDLHEITLKAGTDGCVVLSGLLDSPYSGELVDFDRTDSTIDIDHVVALSDAWQTGAAGWDENLKREFANDPLNLLAVEASLNRQKGDGDAATWLPPKRDYRCEYVSRQIAVKDKYGLWVKPAEADAMRRVLDDCDGFLAVEDEHEWPANGEGDVIATEAEPTEEPAPAPAPAPAPDPEPAPAPSTTPAPAPAPAPKKESGSGGSAYYKNCDAARAAGAAPVRVGDPGYRKGLDRDGDGVGCE